MKASSSSSLLNSTNRPLFPIRSPFAITIRVPKPLPISRRHNNHSVNAATGRIIISSRLDEHQPNLVNLSAEMISQPILEQGVFRFDSSEHHRDTAFPSLSFTDTKLRDTPIATHLLPLYLPTFEHDNDKQIVNFEFPDGTSFYGTGEVSGQLERTGKRIFTWNTDAWGYGPATTSLYQSHPWVLCVLPNGEALGVLADTTRRCEIDLRKEANIRIIAPISYPLITFGPFDSPTAVLMSLSRAIGKLKIFQ